VHIKDVLQMKKATFDCLKAPEIKGQQLVLSKGPALE
jgi:hypothetical protein